MANVLNRTTLQYLTSVNDVDYSDPPWLFNPDTSLVAGVEQKYWKLSGDTLSEMTQGEKDAVDAQLISDARDSIASQFDNIEDTFRAFALAVLDELNNHTDKINEILDAADNAVSLADFKARMGLISDYPQRTVAQMKTAVRNKLGS